MRDRDRVGRVGNVNKKKDENTEYKDTKPHLSLSLTHYPSAYLSISLCVSPSLSLSLHPSLSPFLCRFLTSASCKNKKNVKVT